MYDVVIVGGGPAGASAGRALAEAKLSCLILDKAEFPRDKPCGGSLSIQCIKRYPFIEPLVESTSRRSFLCSDYPAAFLENASETPLDYFIRREVFDQQLLDLARNAGVEVREKTRVTGIVESPQGALVTTACGDEFQGKLVFGADGVNSIVRKIAGLGKYWASDKLSYTYVAEVPVNEGTLDRLYTSDRNFFIDFGFQNSMGYGWIFPKRQHINVGFGAMLRDVPVPQVRKLFDAYVARSQQSNILPDDVTPHPQIWPVPVAGGMPIFATNRLWLLGDAAGFCHPLTGEGILYALWSADIAVSCVQQYFRAGELPAAEGARTYQKQCWQEFGSDLKAGVKLQKQFVQQFRLLIPLVKKDPQLNSIFTSYLKGDVPYSAIKWKMQWHVLLGILRGHLHS